MQKKEQETREPTSKQLKLGARQAHLEMMRLTLEGKKEEALAALRETWRRGAAASRAAKRETVQRDRSRAKYLDMSLAIDSILARASKARAGEKRQ